MADAGWIKLHRQIRDWRYWPGATNERFSKTEAWIDLLLNANHAERCVGNIMVKRGQLLTSQVKLAKRWKWDRGTVSIYLRDLEKFGEAYTYRATGHYTMITICNYETYQGIRDRENAYMPQVTPQVIPHKQELKNEKKKEDLDFFEEGGLIKDEISRHGRTLSFSEREQVYTAPTCRQLMTYELRTAVKHSLTWVRVPSEPNPGRLSALMTAIISSGKNTPARDISTCLYERKPVYVR